MSVQERTRAAIRTAFNSLIRTTEFQSITVDKICQESGVSRATFYRYYADKYDVMDDNYRILLSTCASRESVHSFESLYTELFSEAHADFWVSIRRSFRSEGYNSFRNFIAKHSFDFAKAIVEQTEKRPLTEAETLQMEVFTHGIARVYEDWTLNRYDLTPAEAAAALAELMPESLRNLWV